MSAHLLQPEVDILSIAPVENYDGAIYLLKLKGKNEYYIAVRHWFEGYVGCEVTKKFAKAFTGEFSEIK